jgi:hypothetical protein
MKKKKDMNSLTFPSAVKHLFNLDKSHLNLLCFANHKEKLSQKFIQWYFAIVLYFQALQVVTFTLYQIVLYRQYFRLLCTNKALTIGYMPIPTFATFAAKKKVRALST